jgi:UDP-glucose 4-epimerase
LVLLASTSEVYGKSSRVPFREDDDLVLGPTNRSRWAYACSKALDEWLALAYRRERELPVIVARLFNTVGPRQTAAHGMVLPGLAAQAVRDEPMTVFGSGEQTRCFAHVDDVLLAAPAAVGEVFNVGTDRETSINALAELVRVRAASTSDIVHVPYAEAYVPGFEDMARRVPDLQKLARVVGFKPAIPLERIVEDVVAHERARLERSQST